MTDLRGLSVTGPHSAMADQFWRNPIGCKEHHRKDHNSREGRNGLIPKNHRLYNQQKITSEALEIQDILLLEDGHCFKDSVINLCSTHKIDNTKGFQLASGSFDTLIKLSKEGLGMTLLPYLHTLDLNEEDKANLRDFTNPPPAREVSLIYHKSQLKMQLIEALKKTIDGIIRGAISFSDVKIVSPLAKR